MEAFVSDGEGAPAALTTARHRFPRHVYVALRAGVLTAASQQKSPVHEHGAFLLN